MVHVLETVRDNTLNIRRNNGCKLTEIHIYHIIPSEERS